MTKFKSAKLRKSGSAKLHHTECKRETSVYLRCKQIKIFSFLTIRGLILLVLFLIANTTIGSKMDRSRLLFLIKLVQTN